MATMGVMSLGDSERTFCWMLVGYLEGGRGLGIIYSHLVFTENVLNISLLISFGNNILFTGGWDVYSQLYDEEINLVCGEVCGKRDAFKRRLFL